MFSNSSARSLHTLAGATEELAGVSGLALRPGTGVGPREELLPGGGVGRPASNNDQGKPRCLLIMEVPRIEMSGLPIDLLSFP